MNLTEQPTRPGRGSRLANGNLISRRDYLRMLVVVSGGLLFGTAGVAAGIFRKHGSGSAPDKRIAGAIPPGKLVSFSFPGEDDPAIALRLDGGELVAYSSVCTHLACAVLWRRDHGVLECPCHDGVFDLRTGEVTAGPPPRALPRITLVERVDGVYATGTQR
ncbi:MAG: ubiquinol-cytochrome c reductase iron-sulfur subunit [Actinomycetota bacterium]